MTVTPKAHFQPAKTSATAPLLEKIHTGVAEMHKRGTTVAHAAGVSPAKRATRLTQLYTLLTGVSTAVRDKALKAVAARLRVELEVVFRKIPLKPQHFGFATVDQFVDWLAAELAKSGTGAGSRAEFVAGIKGWRWALAGRVLFERLVKHHPQLTPFFQGMADDWAKMINSGSRQMVDLAGNRVSVDGRFRRHQRVEYFEIIGADGKPRASTDFGFMAVHPDGRVALLPVELKMPAALSGVAAQFSEFIPRLADGKKLIAYVSEGPGKELKKVTIDPNKLVFLKNDGAQVAVAPYGRKRFEQKFGTKHPHPSDVGKIAELDQGVSPTRGVVFYRARLMVKSTWISSIVEAVTDPPKK